MVSAIECRQEPRRMIRIPHGLIKIDHPIKYVGGSNPPVNGFALSFLFRCVVSREFRTFKRSQGSAEDQHTLLVRTLDKLVKPRDEIVGTHFFGWRGTR